MPVDAEYKATVMIMTPNKHMALAALQNSIHNWNSKKVKKKKHKVPNYLFANNLLKI